MELLKENKNIEYCFEKLKNSQYINYLDDFKTVESNNNTSPLLVKTNKKLNKNVIFPSFSFIYWNGDIICGLFEEGIEINKTIGHTNNTSFSIGLDNNGIIWHKKEKLTSIGKLVLGDLITIGIDYFTNNLIFFVIDSKKLFNFFNIDIDKLDNLKIYTEFLNSSLKKTNKIDEFIRNSSYLKFNIAYIKKDLKGGVNLIKMSKISIFNDICYQEKVMNLLLKNITLNCQENWNKNLLQSEYLKVQTFDKNLNIDIKKKQFQSSLKLVLKELKNIGCFKTYESIIDYFYLGKYEDDNYSKEKNDRIKKIKLNFDNKKYLEIIEDNKELFENKLNSKLTLYILHFINLFYKEEFEELIYFSQNTLNPYKNEFLNINLNNYNDSIEIVDFMRIISMSWENFLDSKFSKILDANILSIILNDIDTENTELQNLIKTMIVNEKYLREKNNGYFNFYKFN